MNIIHECDAQLSFACKMVLNHSRVKAVAINWRTLDVEPTQINHSRSGVVGWCCRNRARSIGIGFAADEPGNGVNDSGAGIFFGQNLSRSRRQREHWRGAFPTGRLGKNFSRARRQRELATSALCSERRRQRPDAATVFYIPFRPGAELEIVRRARARKARFRCAKPAGSESAGFSHLQSVLDTGL
jgi:hypothetical protein